MLGFVVVVAPALAIAVVALFLLILALGYVLYLKPLLDWLSRSGGGFFKRIVFWPVRKASEAVQRFMKEHVAAMLRSYVNGIDPLVLVLIQLDEVIQRTAGTLGDMAEQTFVALHTLRHETVPRLITTALVPIRAQLERHTDRLDQLEDLNRAVAVVFGDTLRALPWGPPGGYVSNIQTFGDRFVQLWRSYYDVTRVQLTTLLAETIPDLRRDLVALTVRVEQGIDARLDALGARLTVLEQELSGLLWPRIDAMQAAIDALAEEVFGDVGDGLVDLFARVAALELAVFETIPSQLLSLRDDLAQLRTELETGIVTGLEAFRERLEAVELAIGTLIPARLDAMQAAIDALAAEIFGEIEGGLVALFARVQALEDWVFGELREQIELQLGRIEAVEAQIANVILPRIASLEAMLAPAAFAALVLSTMRTVAPNLFCNNVTRATQVICAQPAQLLDDILALGLPILVLTDICAFARLIRDGAEAFAPVLSQLVGFANAATECAAIGSPPNLNLTLTALPPAPQAIAL